MNLNDTIHIYAGKKVRRALQAKVSEHEALQAELTRQLRRNYQNFQAGRIDAEEFHNRFQRRLVAAYESAFRAGKGDENLTNKDRRWINTFAANQFEFLNGFVSDLQAGREPISNDMRIQLYGRTAQGAYWKGALSDYDDQIEWVLGMNDNNCESCLELADGSPYAPEDLPTVPGAGDTDCLSNCHCTLVGVL